MTDALALQRWMAQLYPQAPHSQLADGSLICKCLLDIDPETFKSLSVDQNTTATTWVLRLNRLKRALTLIRKTLKERGIILSETGINASLPNLQRIAKDGAPTELAKLLQLVLVVAVQSSRKGYYVDAVAKLDEADQLLLTQAIEDLQGLHKASNSASVTSPTPSSRQGRSQDLTLSQSRRSEAQQASLQRALTSLTEENRQLKAALSQFEQASQDQPQENGQVSAEEILLKQQCSELKRFLEQAEAQIAKLESEREEQGQHLQKLERRLVDSDSSALKVASLRESLAELNQLREQFHRIEKINEKYKRKLETMSELQRELAKQEERNVVLQSQLSELEHQRTSSNAQADLANRLQHEVHALSATLATQELAAAQHAEELFVYKHKHLKLEKALEKVAALERRIQELEAGESTLIEPQTSSLSSELSQPQLASTLHELEMTKESLSRALCDKEAMAAKLDARLAKMPDAAVMSTGTSPAMSPPESIPTDRAEMAQLKRRQEKAKALLRQQDAMIKELKKTIATAAKGESDITLQAQLDRAYQLHEQESRAAAERERMLKQENMLVAQAFFDLASRLSQSNLSLHRTMANPKSFLARQRQVLDPLSRYS